MIILIVDKENNEIEVLRNELKEALPVPLLFRYPLHKDYHTLLRSKFSKNLSCSYSGYSDRINFDNIEEQNDFIKVVNVIKDTKTFSKSIKEDLEYHLINNANIQKYPFCISSYLFEEVFTVKDLDIIKEVMTKIHPDDSKINIIYCVSEANDEIRKENGLISSNMISAVDSFNWLKSNKDIPAYLSKIKQNKQQL